MSNFFILFRIGYLFKPPKRSVCENDILGVFELLIILLSGISYRFLDRAFPSVLPTGARLASIRPSLELDLFEYLLLFGCIKTFFNKIRLIIIELSTVSPNQRKSRASVLKNLSLKF